jgi:hypothetical protein
MQFQFDHLPAQRLDLAMGVTTCGNDGPFATIMVRLRKAASRWRDRPGAPPRRRPVKAAAPQGLPRGPIRSGVMLVGATMLPPKAVFAPIVAELPICQYTLEPPPPLIISTDERAAAPTAGPTYGPPLSWWMIEHTPWALRRAVPQVRGRLAIWSSPTRVPKLVVAGSSPVWPGRCIHRRLLGVEFDRNPTKASPSRSPRPRALTLPRAQATMGCQNGGRA